MATTDAVKAVCDAITHILRAAMADEAEDLGLEDLSPSFEVYTAADFTNDKSNRNVTTGASVFLYRVFANLAHRTPAGRVLPDGRRHNTTLPLDLHLLVTIWAADPGTQNSLVGWVLRTLEDYPVIPAAVLNVGSTAQIFRDEEAVELVLSEMDGEELLQVWDMLGNGELYYQITIPYLVRNVGVESSRVPEIGEPVQIRTLDMQRYDGVPT